MDQLKLSNQLCFPLYAAARGVVRMYTPLLTEIGLTYTQYITMMVVWEKKIIHASELGRLLYLDSGTLTPLLKKLEKQGLVTRSRSQEDERHLIVTITDQGEALKEKAASIPLLLKDCLKLDVQDARMLYTLLYKMLEQM